MDTQIEDTTKRTIERVLDKEEGVFIDANEFFSRSEGEIIAFRRHLEEAIRLNQPRFACPRCGQMVKISGRYTEKGKASFFSHLYDSDDCEIKTTTQLSKEEIEARMYAMVCESKRHKRLKAFIGKCLENDPDVSDVMVSKRIKSDIPYLNWRCPDVTAQYKGKKLVFEIQLSTMFHSIVVDRDIFYRLNNYYIIWVFNFDNRDKKDDRDKKDGGDNKDDVNNKLTLENLLAKDIYYANKRNVFILDEEAMAKSVEENKLYLSVQWLQDDNKFSKSKLIALDELSFDDNSCKPYYFDADSLYYKKHPEEQERVSSLERSRQQVLELLMKKEKEEAEKKQRIEEAQAKKREEMRLMGYVATPYMKSKKWGYEFNGTKLTLPIYSSASEIDSEGYGYVERNRRKGLVDQYGVEILPCQFRSIYPLSNGCFLVDEGGEWRIFKGASIGKVKKGDVIIRNTLNDTFVSVSIEREKENVTMIVRKDGQIKIVDAISDFEGKTASLTLNGSWKTRTQLRYGYRHYYKKYQPGENRLFTFNGYTLEKAADLEKNFIPAVAFTGESGLLNQEFLPITPFDYSELSVLDDDRVKVKKESGYGLLCRNKETGLFEARIPCLYDDLKVSSFGYEVCKGNRWGVVDKENEIVVPIEYDSTSVLDDDRVKVKKESGYGLLCRNKETGLFEARIPCLYDDLKVSSFGYEVCKGNRWGVVDKENEIVVPIEYDSIGEITEERISVEKDSHVGAYDKNGKEIIEGRQPFATNLEIGKFCDKYGIIDADGNILLDFKYNSISLLNDVCIKADGNLFKLNGELLCSDVSDVKVLTNGMVICKTIKDNCLVYNSRLCQLFENYAIREVSDFVDGKATVELFGGKKGLITEDGQVVTESAEPLGDKLTKQKIMGSWGVKNADDEWIYPAKYEKIVSIGDNAILLIAADSFTIIDSQGSLVKEFEQAIYDSLINGSLIKFKSGRSYGLLDYNGKSIIECGELDITVQDNRIHVVDFERFHTVYDMSMNKLCEFYHERSLESGYRKISLSRNEWGCVDSEWNLIVPCRFDVIDILSDYWFAMKQGGKWGCVSSDKSQSYPCVYPNVMLNPDNIPSVKIGSKLIPCSDYVERKRLDINHTYNATVCEIRAYGLMVKVEGFKCLIHISELKKQFWKMSDFAVGDKIDVLVLAFDRVKKRYSLSIVEHNAERKRLDINQTYNATIYEIRAYGLMVKVEDIKCLLHVSKLKKHGRKMSDFAVGDKIDVLVTAFDKDKKRYSLSLGVELKTSICPEEVPDCFPPEDPD